ncbi:MAG: 30S ribosomal protein S16 [Candidatus Ryanbacteria bacterium RIFCSPHIGHO2_02_FULL_45_17b]|uniref:Small ribosomal subunit protein bS16 n=1 Tax=Candidatus Ryanbacteria bacterium RIFCSPHIGHO2_01_FULL_45_22 TaxID=1802114 RepID=A0A1G2G2R6_9BACT|nr:MAG: 30S ribosomal protein S16 [Candidatus Ryanbacteria bacterium RIFCSPHIGHO2_01_FULL_45_22]OGZ47624.1 MAG: 30S ribosomal protein S16 [Candidatus Ryanbacteria bacterium RIFCSPHIGHO2_02_FULL_45_17b]
MLAIRLQRVGKRNNPVFRVVLTDKRNATKSGSFLEILGSYNPQHEGVLSLKKDRISHWLSKGVQPSDTMHNLLVKEKIIDAPKRNAVAPSKLKKPEPIVEVSVEPVIESASAMEEQPKEDEKPADLEPVPVAEELPEKKKDA